MVASPFDGRIVADIAYDGVTYSSLKPEDKFARLIDDMSSNVQNSFSEAPRSLSARSYGYLLGGDGYRADL